jgi:hypothetical protein
MTWLLHETVHGPPQAIHFSSSCISAVIRIIIVIPRLIANLRHGDCEFGLGGTLPTRFTVLSTVAQIADLAKEFYTKTCLVTLTKEQSSPFASTNQFQSDSGILR